MTLGSHQRSIGKSQTHITPKWIIDALGPFDLDPAAAYPCAWYCAEYIYTEEENGLTAPWHGFVWLNPPYDFRYVAAWMKRMREHNHGIALLHARTETKWFNEVWLGASGILFMDKRLNFYQPDGTPGIANSGAPPVLCAFGELAFERLAQSQISGWLVTSRYRTPLASPSK